jgi:hypothetical protein
MMDQEIQPTASLDFAQIISEHYKDLTKAKNKLRIIYARIRKNPPFYQPVKWPHDWS